MDSFTWSRHDLSHDYCWRPSMASLRTQTVKHLPAMWATPVRSLGWEDPLEKKMATHSSTLAWRIPMDRGTWQVTVHGVAESWTRLSDFLFFCSWPPHYCTFFTGPRVTSRPCAHLSLSHNLRLTYANPFSQSHLPSSYCLNNFSLFLGISVQVSHLQKNFP